MIDVVIADDDNLIRESLKIILSIDNDINVVDVFENGQEAMKYCLTSKVDVALLDVRMPVMNGVDATKEIVMASNAKVIILTTFDEDEYINKALRNGASGYLLKNNPPENIINAIKMVHSGNSVIQDNILSKISENISTLSNNIVNKDNFTQREAEIIELVAQGLSNKEISKNLFISEGTVKNYISSILDKTNLEHRTQIAINYLKGRI